MLERFEDIWARCGGAPRPAAEPIPVAGEPITATEVLLRQTGAVFDTPLAHDFDSWKDSDLYRAMDLPENGEPGEAQDREIEEYARELTRRYEERRDRIQREHALRLRYSIPEPPPARDGIFNADEA